MIDLPGARERLDRAHDELMRVTGMGKYATTMQGGPPGERRASIPARPDYDTDLIIGASLGDLRRALDALSRADALLAECLLRLPPEYPCNESVGVCLPCRITKHLGRGEGVGKGPISLKEPSPYEQAFAAWHKRECPFVQTKWMKLDDEEPECKTGNFRWVIDPDHPHTIKDAFFDRVTDLGIVDRFKMKTCREVFEQERGGGRSK